MSYLHVRVKHILLSINIISVYYVFDPSSMLDDSHCSDLSGKSIEVSRVVLIK